MVYSFVVPGEFKLWEADDAVLAIHAVDFGMGFCSKLLPGAVYNLFFDSVGTLKTSLYLSALLIGFFIILSFLLEKFILKVEPQHRKTAFIILAFFLTGPATFAIHVYYPGMLDMYWVFCALLLFLLLSKKQLTPLMFLPFVLCVTIYFASLICFIPFFVIIILYKISCTQEKKEKVQLWSMLIVSSIAAVGLGIYFAVCEERNLIYSMEEFHELYSSRGTDNFFYFDRSLYKYLDNSNLMEFVPNVPKWLYPYPIICEIIIRVSHTFAKVSIPDKLIIAAIIMPIIAFIFSFLKNQIKANKTNKLKAFSFVCMILLPFATMVCALLFSEDVVRWIGNSFLLLFTSFIYILYKEGQDARQLVEERISKIPLTTIILYLTFYAFIVYHPYYVG